MRHDRFTGLLLSLTLTACAERALELGDDDDTVTEFPPPPPRPHGDWDCLDSSVPTSPNYPATPEDVEYTVPILDSVSNTPPAGLDASLCLIEDVSCDRPLLPAFSYDTDGILTLTIPYHFQGGLRLTARRYMTTTYMFIGPVIGNREGESFVKGPTIRMLPVDAHRELLNEVNLVPSADAGTMMFIVEDCAEAPVRGARFEIETTESHVPWVSDKGVPRVGSSPLYTDESGLGGFFNVTRGRYVVRAFAPQQRYSGVWVVARRGEVSLAHFRLDVGYGH